MRRDVKSVQRCGCDRSSTWNARTYAVSCMYTVYRMPAVYAARALTRPIRLQLLCSSVDTLDSLSRTSENDR
jgi:hypothetical protein